ncbi:hypothetical protein Hanom_Chr14g01291661 [Helianthus anomalus]
MHRAKYVSPTCPSPISVLTLDLYACGLSLRTAVASRFNGSSWFGPCILCTPSVERENALVVKWIIISTCWIRPTHIRFFFLY